MIDVELNPRTGLTLKPPFSSLLAKFARSRHPISFMMGLPPAYQDALDVATKIVSVLISFPGSGPLAWVMEKIGFPRVLGFSMTRNGETFPLELLAMMKDETAAGLILGAFNLVQSLHLGLLADRMPKKDKEALENISLTRNGALLSIKMVMREGDLPR